MRTPGSVLSRGWRHPRRDGGPADLADLEVYTQVLTGTLAQALLPDCVPVECERGLADRLAGRDGRIEVFLGEQRLMLDMRRPGLPKWYGVSTTVSC